MSCLRVSSVFPAVMTDSVASSSSADKRDELQRLASCKPKSCFPIHPIPNPQYLTHNPLIHNPRPAYPLKPKNSSLSYDIRWGLTTRTIYVRPTGFNCKRSKLKCVRTSGSDPTCVRCRQRGIDCAAPAYHVGRHKGVKKWVLVFLK